MNGKLDEVDMYLLLKFGEDNCFDVQAEQEFGVVMNSIAVMSNLGRNGSPYIPTHF